MLNPGTDGFEGFSLVAQTLGPLSRTADSYGYAVSANPGASFYGSNIAGAFSSGDIIVTATDADGAVSRTLVSATTDSFLGFVSDRGALSSVSVSSVQPLGAAFLWPTVDNLVLAAVPEPETYALLLAGLGIVGFMARRRRRAD